MILALCVCLRERVSLCRQGWPWTNECWDWGICGPGCFFRQYLWLIEAHWRDQGLNMGPLGNFDATSTKFSLKCIVNNFNTVSSLQHWETNPCFCACKAASSLLGYTPNPNSTTAHACHSHSFYKGSNIIPNSTKVERLEEMRQSIQRNAIWNKKYSQLSISAGFVLVDSVSEGHVWTENIPGVQHVKVLTTGWLREEDLLK